MINMLSQYSNSADESRTPQPWHARKSDAPARSLPRLFDEPWESWALSLEHSLDGTSSDLESTPPNRESVPRYQLALTASELSSRKSLQLCRRGFRLPAREGEPSLSAYCGNSWCCVTCSSLALYRNQTKTQHVLDLAPGALSFTFTQESRNSEPLSAALSRLRASLRSYASGKGWKALRERHGVLGHGYVLELTHKPSGWHPHAHGFMILDTEPTAATAHDIAQRWTSHSDGSSPWAQSVTPLSHEHAHAAARYLAKDSSRRTTTGTNVRTLGDLTHDAYVSGDADALELLHEVEQATIGARRVVWTPGIEKILEMAPWK